MPRKEINYKNNVIYKIVCNDLKIKDLYVGQTTDFARRKSAHRFKCNDLSTKINIYNTIRINGGWTNWSMIEIEKYPCLDSNEARARERYWFETLYANLNERIPITTETEKKEYNKQFYEENKDLLKEKRKIYSQKEEVKIKNRENVKRYVRENKYQILERQRANVIKLAIMYFGICFIFAVFTFIDYY